MKKSILLSMAIFMAMALSSCSKEFEPTIEEIESIDVTFSLDAETALVTRAISDGTGANQLMYGVFNDKNELIIAKAIKNDVSGLTGTGGGIR